MELILEKLQTKGVLFMILSGIKRYFSQQPVASLADLSVHFGVEPDAMRGMLEQWIRKGKLRKLPQGTPCPSCCEACKSESLELYKWLSEME